MAYLSCLMTSLAAGNAEGFWFVVVLCLMLWAIVSVVAKTAEDHRHHARSTDRKRCTHCRVEHPGFAVYCRQCGRRF